MKRPDISADRVLAEEARIAFADPRAVYGPDGEPLPPHCLDEDTARALAAMEVVETAAKAGGTTVRYKYKFWDKRAALDRLARHLGLAGPDSGPGDGEPAETVTVVLNLGGEPGEDAGEDGEDNDAGE